MVIYLVWHELFWLNLFFLHCRGIICPFSKFLKVFSTRLMRFVDLFFEVVFFQSYSGSSELDDGVHD